MLLLFGKVWADAFELWCWRRLLRSPWTARRSNQSILKEISSEYSLEGLMLELWYVGHFMWRADTFEKTLMLGKIEGRRRRWQQKMRRWMASSTRWTWVWVDSGSWWWTGRPGVLRFMGSQRVGHNWMTELNWTELNKKLGSIIITAEQVAIYSQGALWRSAYEKLLKEITSLFRPSHPLFKID